MQTLQRWFFKKWRRFRDWLDAKDACELCGNEHADQICVGCDKRICCMCDSGYYSDAELCTECRKDISPEEEQQDKTDAANDLLEQCTCPKKLYHPGSSEMNDSTCELSEEDHEYIRKYADYQPGEEIDATS